MIFLLLNNKKQRKKNRDLDKNYKRKKKKNRTPVKECTNSSISKSLIYNLIHCNFQTRFNKRTTTLKPVYIVESI